MGETTSMHLLLSLREVWVSVMPGIVVDKDFNNGMGLAISDDVAVTIKPNAEESAPYHWLVSIEDDEHDILPRRVEYVPCRTWTYEELCMFGGHIRVSSIRVFANGWVNLLPGDTLSVTSSERNHGKMLVRLIV